MRTIAELPFRERRAIELLHLEEPGEVDLSYAGFGWARMDAIWLLDDRLRTPSGSAARPGGAGACDREHCVEDALVLALHSADDGEPLADDIELEFELAPNDSVLVLASAFLAKWLPRLPRTREIVLAMCNPHRATLAIPSEVPIHYAQGDVESWLGRAGVCDLDRGTRIGLRAANWCKVGS
jgi:hypothetical protein